MFSRSVAAVASVAVREKLPSVPTVFSSGHVDRAVVEHLMQLGPTRLLVKPYEIDDLCAATVLPE